ncbi:putative glycoside hydrolase [Tsukamurella sp. 8F]|uniref:putative glycoside hydrolase n=1 Tax=unclassified Tsukamurella TaxID=2633480 RepID=UPI0023B8CB57|nr:MULTISPECIES: putative glycoside hydrolase [unclassified Tsukamurella]MDF0530661.1 putative glycoside hydrolase [Tsukamurella sp. 8J]MDF0587862.1 putative glycoside hydrolase [Tsukamurella sp. 8F]
MARGRIAVAWMLVAALVGVSGCGAADGVSAPSMTSVAPALPEFRLCGFWYAIGRTPTDSEIDSLGPRMSVVVLNPWEMDAKARLRKVNPQIRVLMYKDLASTRNYPGTVDDGADARLLPSGVGYMQAQRHHPQWFATDTVGQRIEWGQFSRHWQMAVWDPTYQRAWTNAVTAEAVRDNWDGVLADNDLTRLGVYYRGIFAGRDSVADSDAMLRDGLDRLVTMAGNSLAAQGKIFVPNIADSVPGDARWERHDRFGGGLDEFYANVVDPATFRYLRAHQITNDGGSPDRPYTLLMTQARDTDMRTTGFAMASLFSTPHTCWSWANPGDYKSTPDTDLLDTPLGAPRGGPVQGADGIWQRTFMHGWVAVNPTDGPLRVTPPPGVEGGPQTLGARRAVVLTRG